jgi:hypothetical protein
VIVRLPNPLGAVVWLALFLPVALLGGWADRAFGAGVFLLGCVVMRAMPSPWEARAPSRWAFKIFLVFELIFIGSYMYSAAFNGIRVGFRDVWELARYVFLGGGVIYLIRHRDARMLAALEWAAAAAPYYFLVVRAADPGGYLAALTLCWLLFFSRLRLRQAHIAAALTAIALNGSPAAWTAAGISLAAALAAHYRAAPGRRLYVVAGLVFFAAVLFFGQKTAGHAALRYISRSPVFGWGPAAYGGVPSPDNQYLVWVLKVGLLGLLAIKCGLALASYRLWDATAEDARRHVGAAAFLGSAALMLGSGRFLESDRAFLATAAFIAGMHETGDRS